MRQSIINTLQQLGYKNPKPTVTPIAVDRHRVELDDKYIGIWDSAKNIFLDEGGRSNDKEKQNNLVLS